MFADIKNDFLFRRIFARHPDLTAALLNDLLDRRGQDTIADLEVLPPELAPDVPGAKLSILDVKCRDQSGRLFVVEMQLLHVAGFLNRIVYNACKAYVAELPAAGRYGTLADVIAVSICDFTIWPDAARDSHHLPRVPLVSRWSLRERVSLAEGLDQIQYAFVELPKVPDEGPLDSPAEQWAWLFRLGHQLSAIPPALSLPQRRTMELAEEATFTPGERDAYRKVEDEIEQARQLALDAEGRGRAEGLALGIEQGIEQGRLVEARATLRRVLARRGLVLSPEQQARIDACTALSSLERWLDNAIVATSPSDLF